MGRGNLWSPERQKYGALSDIYTGCLGIINNFYFEPGAVSKTHNKYFARLCCNFRHPRLCPLIKRVLLKKISGETFRWFLTSLIKIQTVKRSRFFFKLRFNYIFLNCLKASIQQSNNISKRPVYMLWGLWKVIFHSPNDFFSTYCILPTVKYVIYTSFSISTTHNFNPLTMHFLYTNYF